MLKTKTSLGTYIWKIVDPGQIPLCGFKKSGIGKGRQDLPGAELLGQGSWVFDLGEYLDIPSLLWMWQKEYKHWCTTKRE